MRVQWTSSKRPADDELFKHWGTSLLRLGTGFVCSVNGPEKNLPCPCAECGGEKITNHWTFLIRTANHVVYNEEEAKATKVDFFFNIDSNESDGTMKTEFGLELDWSSPGRDICRMVCVTHDEALAQRIESAWRSWRRGKVNLQDLSHPELLPLPTCGGDREPALIISHPHGRSKKISIGYVTGKEEPVIKYNTATCPGSSGAPVFVSDHNLKKFRSLRFIVPVHCGSYEETTPENADHGDLRKDEEHRDKTHQLNFGYHRHIT
ncbi:hypothetical protein ElyMa_003615300 [Elysia marginata]|uniref:Peptidase S1 domain-containing protein n=1 Tax=Elysia marginata TaxID=1093978 RepID=A0AAV4ET63_9GAST|nr:hypothetical protein ElyMa_003615300 [Elysia marginata]